jgi:hypothetical protein
MNAASDREAVAEQLFVSFWNRQPPGTRTAWRDAAEAIKSMWRDIAGDTLSLPSSREQRLVEALREIRQTGTRLVTSRIGDAYSDDGWEDHEVISEEAEIASTALAELGEQDRGAS